MEEITDVACTACGCVCDDLRVRVEDGRIASISPDCPLAERWFLRDFSAGEGVAFIGEKPATIDEAVQAAAKIIRASRAPLVYGLSNSSTDGQRAACRLADRLGATIDTTASTCHGPSIVALQQTGESTCSLGEIRNRADLVIYWGCDPVVSHPRHMDRYAWTPAGQFVPNGARDRTLVVVDTVRTKTAELADVFIQVESDGDFDVLWTLRGLLAGANPSVANVGGAPMEALRDLAERMKACRCGVFFFGRGLAHGDMGHADVQALLSLTRDLNGFTRFHARRMRVYGDVAGADTVLCWQTGYPFSVNLARGYPRYNPGEYSANELLERGEIDCCVLVGAEGMPQLSAAARAALDRVPKILIEKPGVETQLSADVRFVTGVYGIHHSGTAYRMDEVPIPLRAFLPSNLPSDADVLARIQAAL